jgi:hypothetical protein
MDNSGRTTTTESNLPQVHIKPQRPPPPPIPKKPNVKNDSYL